MRLDIVLEHRFERLLDGSVWTASGFRDAFWSPYLSVFEEVRVLARSRLVDSPSPGAGRADGPQVRFVDLPYYHGPWGYLRQLGRLRACIRSTLGGTEAMLLRMPSPVGSMVAEAMRTSGRPYAIEVLGDPYDLFAPGAIRHPLRPLLRSRFTHLLRRHCSEASGVLYVTQSALQRRYPPAAGAITLGCSDAQLPPDAYVEKPRSTFPAGKLRLITVGSLEQAYKGTDVLIDALALCRRAGTPLSLVVVGEGRYRASLARRCARRGVSDLVRFAGFVSAREEVRLLLDEADLFVLPSRTEGLPKAMLEAMARALPCIGSAVGGVPELLAEEDLVPPGDAGCLAARLCEVAVDHPRLARMSDRNLARAREHSEKVLLERRTWFYEQVKQKTAECLRRRGQPT